MASRIDEVEAAMDSVVNNMATVEARLILKVALKLVVDVLDNRPEAEMLSFQLAHEQYLLFMHNI